jgi:hypothetical protein
VDIPLDQLEPLVVIEDPALRHALEFVDGEAPALSLFAEFADHPWSDVLVHDQHQYANSHD